MSATHPDGSERDFDALRRAQRAHEPSMEELLASIRAIISEDRDGGAGKAAPAQVAARPAPATGPQIVYSSAAPVAAKAPEPVAPVKDAEPVAQQPQPQAAPTVLFARKPEAAPVLRAVEPGPLPAAAPAAPAPPPLAAPAANDAPLLSVEADRAISASFEALTASLAMPSAEAMLDMTRDALRPMIKSWLDENLPALVERLVRAEIERVARGAR